MNFIADTFYLNTFKSAEELKLTEEQRDALMQTLNLMETCKIIHVPYNEEEETADDPTPKAGLFNMSVWGGLDEEAIVFQGHCGTVSCMGGTAELIAGKRIFTNVQEMAEYSEIRRLFFDYPGDEVTTEMAAKVLRHYLMTGETRWDLVAYAVEASDDGDL